MTWTVRSVLLHDYSAEMLGQDGIPAKQKETLR